MGSPAFVKSILGPSPWTRIMPTGGVDASRESLLGWFKAGVTAVGIGTQMIRKDFLAVGNYDAITARVAEVLGCVREARAA